MQLTSASSCVARRTVWNTTDNAQSVAKSSAPLRRRQRLIAATRDYKAARRFRHAERRSSDRSAQWSQRRHVASCRSELCRTRIGTSDQTHTKQTSCMRRVSVQGPTFKRRWRRMAVRMRLTTCSSSYQPSLKLKLLAIVQSCLKRTLMIIIIITIKRRFIRRSNMARVTTRAPWCRSARNCSIE